MIHKANLAGFLVAISLIFGSAVSAHTRSIAPASGIRSLEKYYRTELFFGMLKKDGAEVSADEWGRFVDEVIADAFPAGFTVFAAEGRFRGKDGRLYIEKSRVLIVFYRRDHRDVSRRKIDEIRAAYVTRFDQVSVMRVDLPGRANVLFDE